MRLLLCSYQGMKKYIHQFDLRADLESFSIGYIFRQVELSDEG